MAQDDRVSLLPRSSQAAPSSKRSLGRTACQGHLKTRTCGRQQRAQTLSSSKGRKTERETTKKNVEAAQFQAKKDSLSGTPENESVRKAATSANAQQLQGKKNRTRNNQKERGSSPHLLQGGNGTRSRQRTPLIYTYSGTGRWFASDRTT